MGQQININCYGYFNELSGLSEAARSNLKALQKAGIKTNIISFKHDSTPDLYNDHLSSKELSDINFFQISVSIIERYISDKGVDEFRNGYNIGFWAWEFMEIPEAAYDYINLFDEIWVPSTFCLNAFSRMSSIPVINFPHPIEVSPTNLTKYQLNLPDDKFIFLTIFDSYSAIDRKNPYTVIDAFEEAFGLDNPDVCLVIKSMNLEKFEDEFKKFNDRINQFSNITLINKALEREELSGLIENCDSLISLHRSEGFGLTLAEAMAYGKPVIGTGYSGNLEFMKVNNSFLCDYEITGFPKNHGHQLKKGYKCADANVKHAAKLMHIIFKNPKTRKKYGKAAQQYIESELSLENIGNLFAERLKLINNKLKNKDRVTLKLEAQNRFNNPLIINKMKRKKTLKSFEKKYVRPVFKKIKGK